MRFSFCGPLPLWGAPYPEKKMKNCIWSGIFLFLFLASYLDVPRRYPNVESDSFVVLLQTSFWHVDIHIWIVPGQLIPHSTFFCLPWENV